jgi:hypothetical protein
MLIRTLSGREYFGGNELDGNTRATPNFMPLREEIITQNIQDLISRLNGRPILAFFGVRHAMKAMGVNTPEDNMEAWAERLSKAGVDVYSLSVQGIGGQGYWRGENFDYLELYKNSQYQLRDGTFLPSLFDAYPGTGVIYIDLRTQENQEIKMPPGSANMPASQAFDGLVIFKELTPMKNACKVLDQ